MRTDRRPIGEPEHTTLPFRLGTTSFIHPGGWLFNVERLAPRVQDIELLFFELERPEDVPQPTEVDALVACKGRFELSYTVHTPLAASLASENEQRRRDSVDQVRRSMEFAAKLQPDGYVVHVYLGDREGDVPPSDMRTWRSRARRSLVTLCQTVPPSRLCVETLDYDFGHLEPVIDELGLSVAVDVGHLHRDGAPLRDVLLRNLHRTKVIQWHGTDPTGRDHRSLAFFPRSEARWLVDTLCREAYTGILTIEVFTEHDLEESLDVFREISRERAGKELMERKRILVGGGARSGKSAYALHLAHRLGEQRWFVATAQALDLEMQQRIDRHRAERGAAFTTIEEPVELVAALDGVPGSADVVVVDCLTLWLSNLLLRGETEQDLHVRLETLSAALHRVPFHLIFVSNEVGMGVVPESALGRLFRDVTGRTHQHLVPHMDEIYAAILGTILRLKPGPVAVQSLGSES